jgi:hypothetical protein
MALEGLVKSLSTGEDGRKGRFRDRNHVIYSRGRGRQNKNFL